MALHSPQPRGRLRAHQLNMSCFTHMGGLLPSSMIDWPGKLCAVLFLRGCNFRCPYCHNAELLEAGEDADNLTWEELASFLKERAGWLDGVSITGGEPTVHDDLPALCTRLRDMGMAVKVDSNGSRPHLLAELISLGLVDFVAMDFKTSLDKYWQVARTAVDPRRIAESIATLKGSGIEHEFRCTVVPGLVGLEELEAMAAQLAGANAFILQHFRSGATLDPSYRDKRGYSDETLLEWAERLSRLVPTQVRGLVGARSC